MHYTIEEYLRSVPIEKLEEFLENYRQGKIRESYDFALDDLEQVVKMRKANQELNRFGFWGESGPTVIGVAGNREE